MKRTMKKLLAVLMVIGLVFGLTAFAVADWDDVPVYGKMGDVTGDGLVTASDAAILLRGISGLVSLNPGTEVLADLNHDNRLTAADAAMILRFLVGLGDLETNVAKVVGDFTFVAQENAATLTIYSGLGGSVNVPRSMEGHPVTALAAGLFANAGITDITFLDAPPAGIENAGLAVGTIIYVPGGVYDNWVAALGGGTGLVLRVIPAPVYFTVSAPNVVYDGNAHPISVSVSVSGVEYQVSYYNVTLNQTVASPINAGSYTYSITVNDPAYAAQGDISGSFTIGKASYNMSGVSYVSKTEECKNQPADEPGHYILITGTLPTGVSVEYYYLKNGVWIKLVFNPNGTNNGPNEGRSALQGGIAYPFKAVFTGDVTNYNVIPDMNATLTLTSNWSGGWMGAGRQPM